MEDEPCALTWYIAMEASTAILRPWRDERGTSRMESGASSERSLARPLIPMVGVVYCCNIAYCKMVHVMVHVKNEAALFVIYFDT